MNFPIRTQFSVFGHAEIVHNFSQLNMYSGHWVHQSQGGSMGNKVHFCPKGHYSELFYGYLPFILINKEVCKYIV